MIGGMISFNGSYGSQYILFTLVLGHDKQIATIKFLITEVDYARMATIVFPKHCFCYVRYNF